MLKIFLCEDNLTQLEFLGNLMKDYLIINNPDADLVLKTQNPDEILIYLKEHPSPNSMYFLDIDLNRPSMNGLQLAVHIRELDPRGYIVFITSHSEMSYLTFQYKVEAMDFIIKDLTEELPKRIRSCIKTSLRNLQTIKNNKNKNISVKIGCQKILLDTNEILYIETSKDAVHKLVIYTCNSVKSIYGTLKEMEAALLNFPNFTRCHKSIIVNMHYVNTINNKNRILELTNGKALPFSTRYKHLLKN